MQNNVLQFNFSDAFQQQSAVDGGSVSMRQYTCLPGRVKIAGSTRHLLLINAGEPIAISFANEHQLHSPLIVEKNSLICILPAGTSAEIKWHQPLNLAVLIIDPDYLGRLIGVDVPLQQRWDVTNPLLADAFARLFATMCDSSFPERTYTDSLVILLVDVILRHQNAVPADQPGRGKLSPRQLQNVIAFAHDSMQLDIGLMDLANLVHLSAYHFGRLFKQTVGLSPYQYLLQLKIEYAKKLILQKASPLGDIAYQLNFSDQAHFSNAFRKATGVSPRQYLQRQPAIV